MSLLLAPPTLLLLAAASEPAPEPESLATGRALAEARCGRCHNVADSGISPLDKAPPLRAVVRHYPVESLEEALVEGIMTGHPDMPSEAFSPEDAQALIGWLQHIAQSH